MTHCFIFTSILFPHVPIKTVMMKGLSIFKQNPSLRFITPLLVFILLAIPQQWADERSVFWIYGVKILFTGTAIFYCFHGHWREIAGKFDPLAIVVGMAVFIFWILPEVLFPKEREISFNPMILDDTALRALVIFSRMAGACLIVPFVEEIFWRGYLMRAMIRKDFQKVSIGTYTPLSFWFTALTFGIMHHSWQWGVGIVAGVIYGAYLVKTKNLRGCILAHAVTNLCLGIFVLATGQWKFW